MIQKLITFEGGLSTKIEPHLIGRNEGVICENVNLESGSLRPLNNFFNEEIASGKYVHNYNGTFVSNTSSSDERFYVEYGGRLYWSNGGYGTYGLMRYAGTNAGVDAEAPSPLTNTQLGYISINESVSSAGFLTTGASYIYAFTVVDTDGIESTPLFKTGVDITADKSSMKLMISHTNMALIQAAHPDMAGISIYRTGGDNPTFNLVADALTPTSEGVTDDGTNYIWYDVSADIDVSRIELTTFNNNPPPVDLDMLIENMGTFWGAVDNKVYFSRTGAPEFWGALDYVVLDEPCTGLGKFSESIIAFTRTSAYRIDGYNKDNITRIKLPFNQGCVNKNTITNIDAFLVWASMNGICIYDGASIQVVSKKQIAWDEFARLGDLTYDDFGETKWNAGLGYEIQYSVGYQDKYFGVFNNGVLVLDLSNGVRFSTIYLENVEALMFSKFDNMLYFIQYNGTNYNLLAYEGAGGYLDATWKTGRITDGEGTIQIKHYRDVCVDGNPLTVAIYIDGTLRYSVAGRNKFKLPQGLFGKDIQFEVTTDSEMRSIKYEYSVLKA